MTTTTTLFHSASKHGFTAIALAPLIDAAKAVLEIGGSVELEIRSPHFLTMRAQMEVYDLKRQYRDLLSLKFTDCDNRRVAPPLLDEAVVE